MKIKIFTILCSFLIVMLIISGCSISATTGEDLVNADKDHLVVQGYIEAKEVNINSKIAGRVENIKTSEGDSIKKEDILMTISSDTIEAKKEQAEAMVSAAKGQVMAAEAAEKAAQAQYNKAENGTRNQEVEQAKAAFELAEKTFNRTKQLYEEGACSTSTYDEIKTKYEVAKNTYELAKEGARQEDKLAAKAAVAQAQSTVESAKGQLLEAQGALQEVNTYLEDTFIKAPMDGTITSINIEEGELISTGMPLVVLSNLDEQWIEVDVNETDLYMIETGDEVTVKLPAYPDKSFKGIIKTVNKNPDFATKRATNNNGEFDILTFGVKVELQNMQETVYPGMTAIVDFGKRDETK